MAAPVVEVRVRRLDCTPLPRRQTTGAAGLDLCSADAAVVPAKGRALVRTGLIIEVPPGIEAQVRPRSGLAAKHGIGILNSPGTIDSDYRGELKVILFNTDDTDFAVERGDRIAQLVFSHVLDVTLVESEELSRTDRDAGGLGHTGR